MALTDEQITLVQSSYRTIASDPGPTADRFYARLFELNPALRPLFKGDMAEQKEKLMTMIMVAVRSLRHLDDLTFRFQELGAQHVEYGVKPEYYQTVGRALLWALEQTLGEAYTPEVRAAWETTYDLLASTAIEGAQEVG